MVIIFGIKVARCLWHNVVQKFDEKFNPGGRVHKRHRQMLDRRTTDGIAMT